MHPCHQPGRPGIEHSRLRTHPTHSSNCPFPLGTYWVSDMWQALHTRPNTPTLRGLKPAFLSTDGNKTNCNSQVPSRFLDIHVVLSRHRHPRNEDTGPAPLQQSPPGSVCTGSAGSQPGPRLWFRQAPGDAASPRPLCDIPTTSKKGPKAQESLPAPPPRCLEGTSSRSCKVFKCSWDDHLPGVTMRRSGCPLRVPRCFFSVPERELSQQATHRGRGLDPCPHPTAEPLE